MFILHPPQRDRDAVSRAMPIRHVLGAAPLLYKPKPKSNHTGSHSEGNRPAANREKRAANAQGTKTRANATPRPHKSRNSVLEVSPRISSSLPGAAQALLPKRGGLCSRPCPSPSPGEAPAGACLASTLARSVLAWALVAVLEVSLRTLHRPQRKVQQVPSRSLAGPSALPPLLRSHVHALSLST